MHYIYLLAKFVAIYWEPFFLLIPGFLTIYLLKWPLIKDVKISIFTYIGASIYISFYILFFIALRWVQINKEIELKKLPVYLNNFLVIYNKSLFNQIFYTLLLILLILLWIYIFIRLREKLSYQVWKIYFYYNYKYLLTRWQEKKFSHIPENKIIEIFKKYLSYHRICYYISDYLSIFCDKCKLLKISKLLNNLKIMQKFIRFTLIFFIFVFIFYDCYFNNFVLAYTKYYLFFYMLFALWYKISTFFRKEESFLDEIIFEMNYCAPNIVYINVTEEEYEFLNEYLKGKKTDKEIIEYISTFIWAQPPVAYFNRFVYTEREKEGIFSLSEKGFARVQYRYVYMNKMTQRYFPASWLKEKDGKYYTDQQLDKNEPNLF